MSEQAQAQDVGAECGGPMPKTEWHERFAPFVGTFTSEVRMWMGPGEPSVSTGRMVNTLVLEDKFLEQHYTGDEGGPFPGFAGRGYWGYNSVKSCYEGLWIDTVATFFQLEEGHVDESGTKWTMIGSMINPQTGGTMTKKTLITLKDNDHHTMEMFFDMGDGNETRMMEIEYTRAS